MLHTCAARFNVTGNLEKFWQLNKALNKAQQRRRRAARDLYVAGHDPVSSKVSHRRHPSAGRSLGLFVASHNLPYFILGKFD